MISLGMALWLQTAPIHARNYEGKWNRVSLNFSVNVESWGEDCGARPRSYSSKAVKPTEILQNNGHLFFSTGGLRTDRCNSPNPSLVTLTTSRSTHMWTRTCETPAGSGRYEKIDYTFSGSGNRLTYLAESSFRWSLNDSLCVVSWVERRTWERADMPVEEPSAQDEGSPILKVHKDDAFAKKSAKVVVSSDEAEEAVRPECQTPGKPLRLVIAPKRAMVSPSESLCFHIRGVDGNGCRFHVDPQWTVTQNGVAQQHLLSNKGCFVAGDNAAESEGVYLVVAELRGIRVQSTVEVKYPDIGDLALARLDLSDEIDDTDPPDATSGNTADTDMTSATPTNEKKTIIAAISDGTSPPANTSNWLLWTLVTAIVVFVIITIILAVILLRRPARQDSFLDASMSEFPSAIPSAVSEPEITERVATPNKSPDESPIESAGIEEMVCPQCGASYPSDARFCPVDATTLVAKPQKQESIRSTFPPPKGMICPMCKRGYDIGARFCPHDSTVLVEYETWRNRAK